MSKFRFTKRLLKFTALGAAVGAAASASTAASHSRLKDTQRGLVAGSMLAAAAVFTPKVLKSSVARNAMKGAVRNVKRQTKLSGKIVFRRIRGRLIPIRVKK